MSIIWETGISTFFIFSLDNSRLKVYSNISAVGYTHQQCYIALKKRYVSTDWWDDQKSGSFAKIMLAGWLMFFKKFHLRLVNGRKVGSLFIKTNVFKSWEL